METISLQTLSDHEADQVSGGIFVTLAIGVGSGLFGTYLYEQMGGYDGINNAFRSFSASIGHFYRHNRVQSVFWT